MSIAIVTFDIVEYLPSDFKYDNFSFIISSESRDFEQEISYLNKNQITHKASLNKRELKYTIKTTKNSSLIGISDLIIPASILSKKETIFDKTCTIAMSDSVKRVLFGNTSSSNSLKINLHITLQYKEKEKILNKTNDKKEKETKPTSYSGKKVKSYERSESFGKGGDQKKESGPATSTFSQRTFGVAKKNVNTNLKKQRSNSKPASNIKSSQTTKPKTQIFNSNNKLKEAQKAILEDEHNEGEKKNKNKKNESFIDDELNKEIKEINPQFVNFMKEFNNKNPLDKLNSFNDINQMMEYTKNIVEQLLDYQSKYYDMYNKSFLTKNKFKKLLIQYNEKLRAVKKQINKLEEENDLYQIKEDLKNKNNYNNIRELLPLKENELDTFKELYGNYLDETSDNNKEENEKNKKLEEKKKNEEKTQNLLIKVLTHSVNKYGPINKLLTQTNSTEPERANMRNLAVKYNLPLNTEPEKEQNKEEKNESNENKKEEENKPSENNEKKEEEKVNENNKNDNVKPQNIFDGKITKWEFVSTEKPDKIDKKLEQYLKYFYSKRTFPKILFKKTSTNNYEYGTQKVMVKIEGDTIRIRYVGGYLLIDKFIEMNATNEEKKLKKQNEKSSGLPANKKKDSLSNKKK